jgi:hypothetical protein
MAEKLILGCAYCERDDAELGLCCRRHARQVCGECRKTPSFLAEHEPATAAA